MTSSQLESERAVQDHDAAATWAALHAISSRATVSVVVAAEERVTFITPKGHPDGPSKTVSRNYAPQPVTITPELAAEFRTLVYRAVPGAQAARLIPYDGVYKPDPDDLLYLPLADVPDVAAFVERAIAAEAEATPYVEHADTTHALKVYAITIGGAAERAVFVRGFGAQATLKRAGLLMTILRADGVYGRLDRSVLVFEDDVDCVVWGGYVFVVRPHAFRAVFRLYAEAQQRASDAVDAIGARAPIANMEEFRRACMKQVALGEKACRVAAQAYLPHLDIGQLLEINARFEVGVAVDDGTGEPRLVFDARPSERWKLLKLLDDDFLDSGLTQAQYEVNSKLAR